MPFAHHNGFLLSYGRSNKDVYSYHPGVTSFLKLETPKGQPGHVGGVEAELGTAASPVAPRRRRLVPGLMRGLARGTSRPRDSGP
jgi:hypothetical protein